MAAVEFPLLFHIGDQFSVVGPQFSEDLGERATDRYFRTIASAIRHPAGSARAQAEVDNLEKDPYWRFFAKNAETLRGTLSPNECPVAGADLQD